MTAVVITFPASASPVERAARAIYRDICSRRTGFNNGRIPHSIADGVQCSGANRAVVVEARKLLVERGQLERTRDADGKGPSLWRVLGQSADGPRTNRRGSGS